jgi:F-type H+-transporting ATPase subunit delta
MQPLLRRLTQGIARFHTRAALRLADAPPSKSQGPSGPVINLRFFTPNEKIIEKPVYMVTIPAASGVMGILGDHAPAIAQLKPGVVTVHGNDIADVQLKLFVSGGFAAIRPDSTVSVGAIEAIRLEDLDAAAAKKGLDEANAIIAKAGSEKEKAEAQIAAEVNEAILQALESKA